MKATLTYVEQKFEEYNCQIFGGRLPKLPIVLTDEAGALGKVCFQANRLSDGRMEYDDFVLKINTRIDLPESVVEDVIIHEMIHYFILYHNLNDNAPHGDLFKALMYNINATHSRKISITHKSTAEEREQAVSTKAVWHVIAAVYFKSGKTGVKVLPRTQSKIIDYYNKATAHRDVERVEMYLHNNPFFNRYSTSAAFRVDDIDSTLLADNLKGARKLRVSATQVVEER